MLKTLLAALALFILLSADAVVSNAADVAPLGGLSGSFGYSCTTNGGKRECSCSGDADCEELELSDECEWIWDRSFDHPQRRRDLTCSGEGARRSCTCPWAREAAQSGRRPERFDQGQRNAPGSDDITSSGNHRSETVPARRGIAPVSETATDDEAEEDAPRQQVRDHRR